MAKTEPEKSTLTFASDLPEKRGVPKGARSGAGVEVEAEKEPDLSPEEKKAIEAVAMEDAVTNPDAEVVPTVTPTVKQKVADAYRAAEEQLKTIHAGSAHLKNARKTADVLIWHGGRINLTDGVRMTAWDDAAIGAQAENVKYIPELVAICTKHGLAQSSRTAANAARL